VFEGGGLGKGRVWGTGRARWEMALLWQPVCLKKMVFDNENVLWLDLRSQMKP
jgi:hypothetical protein